MNNNLESIFDKIVGASIGAEEEKSAIVYYIQPYNFKEVNTDSYSDEICRYELVEGDQKIVARVESYDHSRTNQLRPDPNHNYLELYDGNKLVKEYNYIIWDSI